MKKTFIAIIAILNIAHISLSAQNKITGSVRDDQTKEGLIEATVYITDLKMGTTTDTDGNFSFDNVPNGNYLFEVKYIGYKNRIERVKIDKNTTLDFPLGSAVSELNEIVVTAVTHSTELKLSPLVIKAVDKNALTQNAATKLIDGLKNIPGVIVHGRYDTVCPVANAWELHKAWPESELRIISAAGHSAFEPGIADALVLAADAMGAKFK